MIAQGNHDVVPGAPTNLTAEGCPHKAQCGPVCRNAVLSELDMQPDFFETPFHQ